LDFRVLVFATCISFLGTLGESPAFTFFGPPPPSAILLLHSLFSFLPDPNRAVRLGKTTSYAPDSCSPRLLVKLPSRPLPLCALLTYQLSHHYPRLLLEFEDPLFFPALLCFLPHITFSPPPQPLPLEGFWEFASSFSRLPVLRIFRFRRSHFWSSFSCLLRLAPTLSSAVFLAIPFDRAF